jgi:hypothetical protein
MTILGQVIISQTYLIISKGLTLINNKSPAKNAGLLLFVNYFKFVYIKNNKNKTMYWIELIKEILIWKKVKKIAKDNALLLEENNLRVDWIGRIYTVINLPPEILENTYLEQPYVISKLREYDQILLKLGISDVIYPEFSKIEGTDAYLLVMYPESDRLNWYSIGMNLLIWLTGGFVSWILFNYIRMNTGFFGLISEFFQRYL